MTDEAEKSLLLDEEKDDNLSSAEPLKENTLRAKTYKFYFEPEGPEAVLVEHVTFFLIVLNIVLFILSTDKDFGRADDIETALAYTEAIAILVFTAEYILRLWSCVEYTGGHWHQPYGRFYYATGFLVIMDVLAIAPWYLQHLLGQHTPVPTTFLRSFRLVKLLKSERYTNSLSAFKVIWDKNKGVLASTGFVGGVVWLLCGTIMYLFERENSQGEGDRFTSVPRAMWYTMVMMVGEFPQQNFTVGGKITGSFIAIIAVGIFAVPTGIIGGGYLAYLEEQRESNHENEEEEDVLQIPETPLCSECRLNQAAERGLRGRVYLFLCGADFWGRVFENVIFFLIVVNVLCFVMSTVESIDSNSNWSEMFDVIEICSVFIFTVEYVSRLWTIVENPSFSDPLYGRLKYSITFFAIVDLASILPWYISFFFGLDSGSTTFIRIFRLLQIFKAEKYVEAFTLVDDVIQGNAGPLLACGFIAMLTWIIFSVLMYHTEKNNQTQEIGGRFISVPRAMWYVLLHLSGEFPTADYTPEGQFLGAIMIVFAIGIFGNFAGILAAGFEDVFMQRQEREELIAKSDVSCSVCSKKVTDFYWLNPHTTHIDN